MQTPRMSWSDLPPFYWTIYFQISYKVCGIFQQNTLKYVLIYKILIDLDRGLEIFPTTCCIFRINFSVDKVLINSTFFPPHKLTTLTLQKRDSFYVIHHFSWNYLPRKVFNKLSSWNKLDRKVVWSDDWNVCADRTRSCWMCSHKQAIQSTDWQQILGK